MPDLLDKELGCFIIGPMQGSGDRAYMEKLRGVVAKLLQPHVDAYNANKEAKRHIELAVRTPYDDNDSGGYIMDDVLFGIDRADIVVAILGNGNGYSANVFYEMGISHALGRPTAQVVEDSVRAKLETNRKKIPFDIASHRYHAIFLEEEGGAEKTINALKEPLEACFKQVLELSPLNPVIDFFSAPMVFASPAAALVEGYVQNFLILIAKAIENWDPNEVLVFEDGGKKYRLIGSKVKENEARERAQGEENGLINESYAGEYPIEDLRIHVYLSDTLNPRDQIPIQDAFDAYRKSSFVAVPGPKRKLICAVHRTEESVFLFDIPTTMSVLESTIPRRLKTKDPLLDWRNHPDSRIRRDGERVEKQEIRRFQFILATTIIEQANRAYDWQTPQRKIDALKRRIEVIPYNPGEPQILDWLIEGTGR